MRKCPSSNVLFIWSANPLVRGDLTLELSLDEPLTNLDLDSLVGVRLFQPALLGLESLEAGNQQGIHFLELGSPLVECRTAYPVLSAEVGNWCPGVGLLEDAGNLVVARA